VDGFIVPRNLAATSAGEPALRDWLGVLPDLVADLASLWSLRVGEPFQPGGQCSWTAPATDAAGTALVLKVAFRFPSGEERDEAAGLRFWGGNGVVQLYAATSTDSACGLLLELCMPGTPLRQVLPEPDQDVVVAGLLRRLWRQVPEVTPFRSLAVM
jgi:streptomycin 6-kinase